MLVSPVDKVFRITVPVSSSDVFPHEKYGLAANDRKQWTYEIIPTEPMHRWKVACEGARKVAKVSRRFHDLRHTFISRLAESQASNSTVMALPDTYPAP